MFERLKIAIRAGRAWPWLLVALLLRLPALACNEGWDGDSVGYLYLGAGLWRGFLPPLQPIHHTFPPGTALLIGLSSFLPAAAQRAATAGLQLLLSAALVVPLGAIARRRAGPLAASWTMALAALAHPLALSAGFFTSEPLMLAALASGVALLAGERRRYAAAPLFALAALARTEAALPAAVAALWQWRGDRKAARDGRPALAALSAALAMPLLWNGLVHAATGVLPLWRHGRAAVAVGAAGSAPAQVGGGLSGMDAGALGDYVLPRMGSLLAANLRWWLLGALPGALFLLAPLLLARLVRRSPPPRLDPLAAAWAAHAFIFLWVWRSTSHAPLLIAPLLPAVGGELARLRTPRLAAGLFALFAVWAVAHQARGWRAFARKAAPPERALGLRLGPGVVSDDLVVLDASDRARWLGARALPLVREGDPPARWAAIAAADPGLTLAVHAAFRSGPPPPAGWPVVADPAAAPYEIRRIPPRRAAD